MNVSHEYHSGPHQEIPFIYLPPTLPTFALSAIPFPMLYITRFRGTFRVP